MAGNKSKHLLKHVVIYTIILELIYLLLIGSDFALIFLVVIFTSHLLIDLLNGYITNKLKDKYNWLNVIIFLTDQVVHVSVLIIFLNAFNKLHLGLNSVNNYLLIITKVSFLIMPSSIIVSKVIGMITIDDSSNTFKLDEGTIIGILERLLIFVMGITGNLSGIGFLIAAKTMVRYGEFDSKIGVVNAFRAKYLIGTLTSVLLGVVFSLIFVALKVS
jgi:hypothetical protein